MRTRRTIVVVAVGTAVLVACGGGRTTHALHARHAPHSVPPVSVEVTTTTTAPPATEPPPTAAPVTMPPPITVLVPTQDCYSLVVEIADTLHRDLGRYSTKQEIRDVLDQDGRHDCYPLVDSVHTLPEGPFGG